MSVKVTLPVNTVKQWKGNPAGINPIIDKLQRDFSIRASFDGKQQVVLSGDNEEIITIAIYTITQQIENAKPPTDGVICTLGKQTVEWRFYGKSALKVHNLFHDKLRCLENDKNISVKRSPSSKTPNCVELVCPRSEFDGTKAEIDDLIKSCDNIAEQSITIKQTQKVKASQFVKDMDSNTSIFCTISTTTIVIYGKENKHVDEIVVAWKQVLDGTYGKQPTTEANKNENKADLAISKLTMTATSGTKLKLDNKTKTDTCKDNVNNVEGAVGDQMKTSMRSKDKSIKSSSSQSTQLSGSKIDTKDSEHSTGQLKTSIVTKEGDKRQSGQYGQSQRQFTSSMTRQPGRSSGSGASPVYTFDVGRLKVLVYKQSITEIKGVDAIVNAANENLAHHGGVAYYISKAAGKGMDDECKSYIDKNGQLPVSKNYISKAGLMPYKGIIHAVGPIWYDYKGRETDCAKVLYDTIMNILRETGNKRWTKVALSAISSGIYGVPKQLCAEMYVKALVDFGFDDAGSVREVHFIDISTEILNLVQEAHKKWVNDPGSLKFENGLNYPNATAQGGASAKSTVYKTGHVRFVREDTTSYGARRFQYRVHDAVNVFIYTGSLTRLDKLDAVVCPIGSDLRGGALFESIRNPGGTKYNQKLKDIKSERVLKEGSSFLITKTGGIAVQSILHIVLERRIENTSRGELDRLAAIFDNIAPAAEDYKLKCLGLSLIGAGTVPPRDIPNLCRCLSSVIARPPRSKDKKMYLEELHLVNVDGNVTTALLNEFKQLSGYAPKAGKSSHDSHGNGRGYTDRTGGRKNYEYRPMEKPSGAQGWELHKPMADLSTRSENNKGKSSVNTQKSKLPDTFSPSSETLSARCCYSSCGKNASEQLPCGHTYCVVCFIPMKTNKVCLICQKEKPEPGNEETCPICMDVLKMQTTKVLNCGHKLCLTCLDEVTKHKPQCPVCGNIFGAVTGTQPDGEMFYRFAQTSLPGYKHHGSIEIIYDFPGGKQGSEHPNPGKPYARTQRRAYLPDNDEGNRVLKLLRRAFDRRLIFTIGESRTTGKEGLITWNDIHHKTKPDGGTENFGYPDPTYLTRVQEELTAKGVTE